MMNQEAQNAYANSIKDTTSVAGSTIKPSDGVAGLELKKKGNKDESKDNTSE